MVTYEEKERLNCIIIARLTHPSLELMGLRHQNPGSSMAPPSIRFVSNQHHILLCLIISSHSSITP